MKIQKKETKTYIVESLINSWATLRIEQLGILSLVP